MNRVLDIYIGNSLCGELAEENNIWSFQYAAPWLSSPLAIALCPKIPLQAEKQVDGSTHRPVQWFFDNLLPEESARILLAKDLREPVDDAFTLLTKAGGESAGAITLLPKGEPFGKGDVFTLSKEEMSQRIKNLPKVPLNREGRKRMSLAGAQHKMLVVYDHGELLEPSGQTPSTHILKPEHTSPEVYYHTPRNEWFCMALAKACGLDTPEVDVLYMPEPVYAVKRFDRKGEYPLQERLHVLDGCQILSLPATLKYRNSTSEYLDKLINLCRKKAISAITIYQWVCFNILIGNGDAHLKNISFYSSKSGYEVAELYDLVSTIIYEKQGEHMNAELSHPIGEARHFSEVTRKGMLTFGKELGLAEKLASRLLDQLLSIVQVEASKLIDQVELGANHVGKAGELRMLREIKFKCIDEMWQKLTS